MNKIVSITAQLHRSRPFRQSVLMVGLCFAAMSAVAHEYYTDNFQIIHPWTLPAPAGARDLGLFLKITEIATADRLLGATSPVAAVIDWINAGASGGQTGVALESGRDLSLTLGRAHLVMHGIKLPLHQGRQYPLTLIFEKAGVVEVDFVVGAH